jgi:hypothetical protein
MALIFNPKIYAPSVLMDSDFAHHRFRGLTAFQFQQVRFSSVLRYLSFLLLDQWRLGEPPLPFLGPDLPLILSSNESGGAPPHSKGQSQDFRLQVYPNPLSCSSALKRIRQPAELFFPWLGAEPT